MKPPSFVLLRANTTPDLDMTPGPSCSPPRSRATLAALLAVLSLGGAGCHIAQPPPKTVAQPAEDVAVTRNQLRLLMRSMVQPMCAQVEQSADVIMAGTTDPDVQMAALRWKIDAVPALRAALFQPDPAIAALDTAVLCNQMIDYFETGPGKQAFGPAASAQAADTCRQMLDELTRALASGTVSGSIAKGAAFARQWAAQHPIRYSIADRQSVLARALEGRGAPEEVSAIQAIADATTTLDDLNRKVDLYSDQLFRQASWEAEWFVRKRTNELRAGPALPLAERATAAIDRLAQAMERASTVAEGAPALATSEREAALKAMHDEVTRSTEFAREERLAVMGQLDKERAAAMQELRGTMDQQREQLTADVRQLTQLQIDFTNRRVTELLAIAMATAIMAALLGLFLARRLFGHRPS